MNPQVKIYKQIVAKSLNDASVVDGMVEHISRCNPYSDDKNYYLNCPHDLIQWYKFVLKVAVFQRENQEIIEMIEEVSLLLEEVMDYCNFTINVKQNLLRRFWRDVELCIYALSN